MLVENSKKKKEDKKKWNRKKNHQIFNRLPDNNILRIYKFEEEPNKGLKEINRATILNQSLKNHSNLLPITIMIKIDLLPKTKADPPLEIERVTRVIYMNQASNNYKMSI